MPDREHFWSLEHLSDRQLLERLQGVLRTQRCTLAELIAHLGEVEERRLHLAAAYGSLFSYCVRQLGMSEDEACRRIELARLARRFPLLFGELASGRISLSVALLLKPVLTPANHAELIAAASGASLRMARELLAARFPSPDVPSRIRKLPDRLIGNAISPALVEVANAIPATADDLANTMPAALGGIAHAIPPAVGEVEPTCALTSGGSTTTPAPGSPQPPRCAESEARLLPGVRAQNLLQAAPTPSAPSQAPAQAGLPRYADRRLHQRIDPLSAERYRIVFTADANLKQKLELARDLLRHSHPSGDFALIVSRALDLLLQELQQRRFGARRKDAPRRAVRGAPHAVPETGAAPIETLQSSAPPGRVPAPTRQVAAALVTAPPDPIPPVAPPLARQPSPSVPVAVPAPTRQVAAALVTAPPNPIPPVAPPLARQQSSSVSVAVPAPARQVATALVTVPPDPIPPAAPPLARQQSSSVSVAVPAPTRQVAAALVTAPPTAPLAAAPPAAAPATGIPRAARRVVLERDGLGCCWVDTEGRRCGSTAWLEFDHQHPSGKGGSSEPANLRLLCRAHNCFAAERAYGRDHVERAIRARQRSAKRRRQGGQPPSCSPAPT
jgi:hypothetical protein